MSSTTHDPTLITRQYAIAPGDGDEETDVESEEMLVNMGPQHPSTHGVLRLVLRTDGEMVLSAVPHLGFLHRCKEKIGESLPYVQYIGYTDRLDYLSAMNNNHAWSMAVEELAGVHRAAPRRIYPRHRSRAEPPGQPSGFVRNLWPGHGGVHAVPLCPARARVHSR